MKTVFLTGGSGFVGSHAAGHFLRDGWRVKALVRRPDRPGLLPAGAEVVAADLRDDAQYRPALAGCDAVVHVAGLVKARVPAEYRAVNAAGAEAVARAAGEACPGAMFVLVSSQAAAGPARNGVPLTEPSPPRPVSWYGRSKLEGEEAVARACPGPWCVVRPGIVYGCGDPGLLQLFTAAQSGFAPLPAGGRMRVGAIAVEDLARVLLAAASRPDLAGRRGFAVTDTMSVKELVAAVAALRRPPARLVPIPGIVVRAAGLLESARQWMTGTARPFSYDKAREALQRDWLCDAGPFLRDLGVSGFKPWRAGICEVARCYAEAGWLRPAVWTV